MSSYWDRDTERFYDDNDQAYQQFLNRLSSNNSGLLTVYFRGNDERAGQLCDNLVNNNVVKNIIIYIDRLTPTGVAHFKHLFRHNRHLQDCGLKFGCNSTSDSTAVGNAMLDAVQGSQYMEVLRLTNLPCTTGTLTQSLCSLHGQKLKQVELCVQFYDKGSDGYTARLGELADQILKLTFVSQNSIKSSLTKMPDPNLEDICHRPYEEDEINR